MDPLLRHNLPTVRMGECIQAAFPDNVHLVSLFRISADGPRCDWNSIDPPRKIGQESRERDQCDFSGISEKDLDIKGGVSFDEASNVQKFDSMIVKEVMCQEDHENPPIKSSMFQKVTPAIIGLDHNGVEEVSFVSRVPEVICDFVYPFESVCVRNSDQTPLAVAVRFVFGNVDRKMIVVDDVAGRKVEGGLEVMCSGLIDEENVRRFFHRS